MSAKCVFIESEEGGKFSVRQMCAWAGVSRSRYQEFKLHVPTATDTWRAQLARLVATLFDASEQTYGYRRIHAEAARAGVHADPHTIRRIMRELGLDPVCSRKSGPRTTVAAASDLPDLVGRDFSAEQGATKLVGDITYIPTWDGWVYLATVLDCATKKVVGHAMGDHMRTDLIIEALSMAARNIDIRPGVTIFHSDRGAQYTSTQFQNYCDQIGVRRSVGRTGICYDNAWAESFNATLKVERVNRTAYPSKRHAINDVTRWIELRYNQVRLHSGLGYKTPNEAERELLNQAA